MKNFKRKNKLTNEDREVIKKLYKKGFSTVEIGKQFRVDHSTIYYYCKNLKKGTTKGKISDELKEYREKYPIKKKSKNYIIRLPKKGKMYADYLKESKDRAEKKKMDRLLKKERQNDLESINGELEKSSW